MAQEVKLAITADTSKAVAEIKKVDAALTTTAATGNATAKTVSQGFKAIESGSKGAGVSLGTLNQQAGILRHNLADMFAGLLRGQSPFAILTQQGPAVAESFAAAGDSAALLKAATGGLVPSLGAAGTVLGVVAIAAAAAGTAWVLYESDQEDARGTALGMNRALVEQEVQGRLTSAEVAALAKSWGEFTTIGRDAKLKIDVINGALTEAGASAIKASEQATNAAKAQISADALRVAQLRMALQAEKDIRDSSEASFDERVAASAAVKGYEDALAAANKTLAEHKGALAEVKGAIADAAEYADESAKAKDADAEASRRAADAARANAKAEAERAAAMREALAVARQYSDAIAGMHAAGLAAGASMLDSIGQEEIARRAAVASLTVDYQKALEAGLGNDAALLAADQEYAAAKTLTIEASEQKIAAIRAAALEDEKAKNAKAVADAQAAEAEKARVVISTLQQASNVSGQLFDLGVGYRTDVLRAMQADLAANEENMTATEKGELKKRIEQQKDAARKAFAIAKAAKIAEALASTALAVINAISQSPPPSPFGFIGAGIAAAAGAVSVANIASQQPSFHKGASEVRRQSMPDEVTATLLEGEAVLSRRAVADYGGRTEIEARNAGRRGGGGAPIGGYPATIQYRHREFNEFIRDNIRLGGPLANAMNTGKRIGHRDRSYT